MTTAAKTLGYVLVIYIAGPGLRKTHKLPMLPHPHLPHRHHG